MNPAVQIVQIDAPDLACRRQRLPLSVQLTQLAGSLGGVLVLLFVQIALTVAFAIFVISYAGILIQPRVDGQPG